MRGLFASQLASTFLATFRDKGTSSNWPAFRKHKRMLHRQGTALAICGPPRQVLGNAAVHIFVVCQRIGVQFVGNLILEQRRSLGITVAERCVGHLKSGRQLAMAVRREKPE